MGQFCVAINNLVSTALYRELTDKLALKIGEENRPDRIQRRHWKRLGEISGTNPRIVWQRLAELAASTPRKAKELAGNLHLDPSEATMIANLLDIVEKRSKNLPCEK